MWAVGLVLFHGENGAMGEVARVYGHCLRVWVDGGVFDNECVRRVLEELKASASEA